MDGKGFLGVAFGGARADARAAARGARGAVGPERGARHRRPRSSLSCGRGPALFACASEGAVSRGMARGLRRYQCKGCGRTFNALSGTPLSGLHHKATLAVVRGVAGEGGDGEGLGGALRRGGENRRSAGVTGLPAARSDSEVLKGIVEADETYVPGEPEGRARAGAQGTAAGRQGEEARPLVASRSRVLWRYDTGAGTDGPARCAMPRVMRRRSRSCPLDPAWSRRTPCWSPTAARSYPAVRRRAGSSHEALKPAGDGGRERGSVGDLHVQR